MCSNLPGFVDHLEVAMKRIALFLGASLSAVSLVAAAQGELLVGNKSDDTVWRLSLEDGRKLGEIATEPGPHEIAISPDGRTAAVTGYGHGREKDGPLHRYGIEMIDTDAGRSLGAVRLGPYHQQPHGIRFTPDGTFLIVTAEGGGSLLRIDWEMALKGHIRAVHGIDVGPGVGHMVALSGDGRIAYVSKIAAGTVTRVDLAENKATHEVAAGKGAEGIEVAPDGSVWVTNRAGDTVTVHDPDTLEKLATLDSQGFPIRVVFTPGGRHALVTNATAGTLSVFDAAARTPVATVALKPEGEAFLETMLGKDALPIGVVADPDRPRVYVAISGANRIAVVDSDAWKVVDYWETGNQPDALGIVGVAGQD